MTSAGPERVAVTVYRNPGRDPQEAMELRWLGGFALVSETRRIRLPAGESVIRFEGVAGGIIPQSAIVTGFPEGIVERNRDAYLLSPSALIDRSLGRRVHLRRTNRATGAVRETDAVVMSGSNGGVVLQTEAGFEALRCTGQAETLVFDGVPEGLATRPTLSVRARASAPVEAIVTLSYLASGFDWQASYVAHLSEDESRVDLFAWLTLGNGDETGFRDAETQAVAGEPNWSRVPDTRAQGGPLRLRCWPERGEIPLQAPPGLVGAAGVDGEDIIVTARRSEARLQDVPVMMAQQENLGDLKLYRIPEPVTVAARSQKQVALLARSNVRVDVVHRFRLPAWRRIGEPVQATRFLVTRNRADRGLGLPLPAGTLVLFAGHRSRPIMVGEGFTRDSAVGGGVEIAVGLAPGVRAAAVDVEGRAGMERRLTVTNDRAVPVRAEVEFEVGSESALTADRRLTPRDGRQVWIVTVPANGSATLTYRGAE